MNEVIQNVIEISAIKGLTSHQEKLLLDYLKSLEEEKACETLKYMIEQRSLIAPDMAKKVLKSKIYVRDLFEYSLASPKIHAIKLWLSFAIDKLGWRATVRILENLVDNNNKRLELVMYYLPQLISKHDTKAQDLVNKLADKLTDKNS